MKKLAVEDVRLALKETQYPSVWEKAEKMPDDDLKKACFRTDFSMDSLDVIELSMSLERELSVSIPDSAIATYISKGGTVQALIDVFNTTIESL